MGNTMVFTNIFFKQSYILQISLIGS